MAQGVEGGRDFSIVGMVQHADPVVQGIAAILIVCSVASWAITFEKIVRLRRLHDEAGALEALAVEGRLPGTEATGAGGALGQAARAELSDGASPGESRTDIRARLERAMRAAMKGELRSIERGLPVLATIGSTTPFVGLLGTVWGIMHSFTPSPRLAIPALPWSPLALPKPCSSRHSGCLRLFPPSLPITG